MIHSITNSPSTWDCFVGRPGRPPRNDTKEVFLLSLREAHFPLSLRGATPQAAGEATKQSLPRH